MKIELVAPLSPASSMSSFQGSPSSDARMSLGSVSPASSSGTSPSSSSASPFQFLLSRLSTVPSNGDLSHLAMVESAAVVQSSIRGFLARRNYAKRRTSKPLDRLAAAAQDIACGSIQALFRGVSVRSAAKQQGAVGKQLREAGDGATTEPRPRPPPPKEAEGKMAAGKLNGNAAQHRFVADDRQDRIAPASSRDSSAEVRVAGAAKAAGPTSPAASPRSAAVVVLPSPRNLASEPDNTGRGEGKVAAGQGVGTRENATEIVTVVQTSTAKPVKQTAKSETKKLAAPTTTATATVASPPPALPPAATNATSMPASITPATTTLFPFPPNMSSAMSRADAVNVACADAFSSVKNSPFRLECSEVAKILSALDVVPAKKLSKLTKEAARRAAQSPTPHDASLPRSTFHLPLGASAAELASHLSNAWADLSGSPSARCKVPEELAAETRRHLWDLMRLPREALAFITSRASVSDYTTDDFAELMAACGVAPAQYHQTSALHKCGKDYMDVTAEGLDRCKAVLRSSLLRCRVMQAVAVLQAVDRFEKALAAERAADRAGAEAKARANAAIESAGGAAPFDPIVEELRRSVGELQSRLSSKEGAIAHLNRQLAKVTAKAAAAGLDLLSPPPAGATGRPVPSDRGVTVPPPRALYRVDVRPSSAAAGDVQFFPPPASQLEYAAKTGIALQAVPASKLLWEDDRVARPVGADKSPPASPHRGKETKAAGDTVTVGKGGSSRRQLPVATVSIGRSAVAISTAGRASEGRFNEACDARPAIAATSADGVPPPPSTRFSTAPALIPPDLSLMPGGRTDGSEIDRAAYKQSPLRGRPRPRTANPAGRSGFGSSSELFVGFGQQVVTAAAEGSAARGGSRSRSRSRDARGKVRVGGKRRITSISSRAVVGGVDDARSILNRSSGSDDDEDDGADAEGRAYHSADEVGDDLDDLVDNGDYTRGAYSLRRQQQDEEEDSWHARSEDEEDDAGRRRGGRRSRSNDRKLRPQSARELGSSSSAAAASTNVLNKAPSSPGADGRRKDRDLPQSAMEAKLSKINENVLKSSNRLNKMLEKLRISTIAIDPKSSEQIIAEAREKERKMKNIMNNTMPPKQIRKPPQVAKGRAGLADFVEDENTERESSDHFPGKIPVVTMRVGAPANK